MNIRFNWIYYGTLLFTFLFAGLGLIAVEIPNNVILAIFMGMMLSTGIPHGATDHILYLTSRKENNSEPSLSKFFFSYLIVMLMYAIAWYLFPLLSLILFLIISAYHFGQSQFVYTKPSEGNKIKQGLYFIWGTLILSGIVFWNWSESLLILETLFHQNTLEGLPISFLQGPFMIVLLIAVSFFLFYFRWREWLSNGQFFFECINLLVLLSLFYTQGLLLSFAIYFGLWHSLTSILTEVQIFQQKGEAFSIYTFFSHAALFSIISFIGIGILLLTSKYLETYISPYLLFFIAISTLTLPHVIYMQKFYALKTDATPSTSHIIQE